MASGRLALGDAKSGRDVNPTLRPDSRLAFRRPGRQTHGAHRTQGSIFADTHWAGGGAPRGDMAETPAVPTLSVPVGGVCTLNRPQAGE